MTLPAIDLVELEWFGYMWKSDHISRGISRYQYAHLPAKRDIPRTGW
jgi:hypothetical protein